MCTQIKARLCGRYYVSRAQKRDYLARARRGWALFLIEGALVLGFIIPIVFSISIDGIYMAAMFMLPIIVFLAFCIFYQKKIQWMVLPLAIFLNVILSVFTAVTENPFWAIPWWLPYILMYLLRRLDHPLGDRIMKYLGASSLILLLLVVGLGAGMYHETPVYQIFIFTITVGQIHFLVIAMWLIVILLYIFKWTD